MLASEDLLKVGDDYYFAARDINAICKFNEETKEIKIIYTDPAEDVWAYRRYGRIYKYEEMLIFLPLHANKILMYNIEEENFETIDVKKIEGYDFDLFFASTLIEEKLILIGCQYPAIVFFCLKDKSLTYLTEPFNELLPKHKYKGDCFFRNDIAVVNNKLYIASCLSNQVLELNIDDGSFVWHTVGHELNKYVGITWDGKELWIAPRRDTRIVRWNPNTNEIKEYDIIYEDKTEEKSGKCRFLGVVYDGENVIFPGMDINATIVYNPLNEDFENMKEILNDSYFFYIYRNGLNYTLNKKYKLKVYKPGNYKNPVKEIKTINDIILIAELMYRTSGIIYEGDRGVGLTDFMELVAL